MYEMNMDQIYDFKARWRALNPILVDVSLAVTLTNAVMHKRNKIMSTTNTLRNIYTNPFRKYMSFSESIGGQIQEQSMVVDSVFKLTMDVVATFSKYKNPFNVLTEQSVLTPLMEEVGKVKAYDSKATEYIFQITLVCKSIKIFEWPKEEDSEKFVANLNKYVQFYRQKAQSEIEGLGKIHSEWLKSWNETYEELSLFIVSFFKNGIHWTGNVDYPTTANLGDSAAVQRKNEHQDLFNEINKGDIIQNVLNRHVTPSNSSNQRASTSGSDVIMGHQKWKIERQKGNHNRLVVNTAHREDCVTIHECEDCTVVIENVINSLQIEKCHKINVLFRTVTKVEVFNCCNSNLHCFEKVISIDLRSCENLGVFLSDKALDARIATQKCSGIHVNFPFEDGLYQNFTISDQLTTKIIPNKGIATTIDTV